MVIAHCCSLGDAQMQLTYEETTWAPAERDELAPEETRNIPFLGFATATLISLGLWSYVAWMIWAVVR
jgi:hypothetical protein